MNTTFRLVRIVVVSVCCTAPVFADVPQVFTYSSLCAAASGGNIYANCSSNNGGQEAAAGPLSFTDSYFYQSSSLLPNSTPVTSIYIASDFAQADYGVLEAEANINLINYRRGSFQLQPGYGVAGTFAEAGFSDVLTVFGPPGNGILDLSFGVDGIAIVPQIGNGDFNDSFLIVNAPGYSSAQELFGSGTEDYQVPFTFGTPFELDVSLSAGFGIFDNTTNTDPYDYFGEALFGHTVTLSDLLVTDTSGNPLSGIGITDQSGTAYSIDALNGGGTTTAATPEPALFVPLAGAMLGLIAILRRRQGSIA